MRCTRRELLISTAAPALSLAASAKNRVQAVAIPDGGIQPQIAVEDSGLHLIYFTGDAKHGDIFYRRSRDFGATWTGPLRVNSQPSSAVAVGAIRGAQISIAKSGRVHVAWNGSDRAEPRAMLNPKAGTFPMLYSRLNPNGTTFEPQRNLMRETFGLDGGGSVTADREGNVYVAWHGSHPGAPEGEAGRRVWIAKSKDGGATFSAERAASP
ncbi:MAG TPA: sialidase family protein, partial [Pirellulales bacterium]|nr:sialidase family protein [Pirellulales bacterium]